MLLLSTFVDMSSVAIKKKKCIILLWFVVFTLFRGLRWKIGTDWTQFYECFLYSDWNNIFSYYRYDDGNMEKMEFGYMFLNVFIKQFGDYTLFLLLTNAFLVGTWAFLSVNLSPNKPIMSFAMIMVSNMLFPVRLQLAAGIVCWAIYFLCKQKLLLALFFVLIAYTVHKSALFVFPMIFLLSKRWPSYILLLLLILSLFGAIYPDVIRSFILATSYYVGEFNTDLANNMSLYTDMEMSAAIEHSFISKCFSFLFSLFILLAFLYVRGQVEKNRSLENLNLRSFNIFINSYLLFSFFYKFFSDPYLQNFQRISEYFTFGLSFCLISSSHVLSKKTSPLLFYVFFSFFYLYRLNGLIFGNSYPESHFPYHSIF